CARLIYDGYEGDAMDYW
nr:immunoglobulin heavy chain junction region [Mus musculus]